MKNMYINEKIIDVKKVENYVQILLEGGVMNIFNPYKIYGASSLEDVIGWDVEKIEEDDNYIYILMDNGRINVDIHPDMYIGPEAFYYAPYKGGGFYST